MIVKNELYALITQCMQYDKFRLKRQLKSLSNEDQGSLKKLLKNIKLSKQQVNQRAKKKPIIRYNHALPVVKRKEDIIQAINNNQVVVIAGETGSGKTTQLPKICLEMGRGIFGQIAHTQPRRLAARSVAERIAQELQVTLGETVGFQIRFSDHSNLDTLVKLMTDGILLAEIQNDRFLNRYDTIIIDEAHERSLNIDFLLGYLKYVLKKRPDLKIIITSATIDVERFSKHFDNAPIIEVSGRAYPVQVYYRPLVDLNLSEQEQNQPSQYGILAALDEITRLEKNHNRLGDVLVFLSGERDIRETAKFLRDANLSHTEILPLYARLSASEQNQIFQSHLGRRIILATNVAETSLTVPGIRYVIDLGMARISRYSIRSKIQRLPIEPISQSSANQRKGRCGRVAEGICFRLYSEEDFLSRLEFTDAEILRTNLAAVILQMLRLNLGDVARFPFIDKPEDRAINDGFKLLYELGAVNDKNCLTKIGRQLSTLPVDPRLARILIESDKNQATREALIIVSGLAIQDPKERPQDKQQAADQSHKEFKHDESDFLTYVQLWDLYETKRQTLSQNQLRKYCKQHFLSFVRMREWRDLHRQLLLACKPLDMFINTEPASYDQVHQSLLSGLLTHIGFNKDNTGYQGIRNRHFSIFPSSTLIKKKPKWLMAFELVETHKVYARVNAKIDPTWIEPLAKLLVNRSYSEPHWRKKRAQVVAYEQVTLFGLIIQARRLVSYGSIDPVISREIFIRSALVEGDYSSKGKFQQYNHQLIEEIHSLEDKTRRRDILVDEHTLYEFYNKHIPENIHNGVDFEKWYRASAQEKSKQLYLTKDLLIRQDALVGSEELYPNYFQWDHLKLSLSYHFELQNRDDGVTLTVPLALLNRLPVHRLQWLVPGLLYDKCVALVRTLPKSIRKNFVPVPDFIKGALQAMVLEDKPLIQSLGLQLKRMTGVQVPLDAWQEDLLESYFFMNIHLIDDKGALIAQGRDMVQLKQQYSNQVTQTVRKYCHAIEKTGLTSWAVDDLPEVLNYQENGIMLTSYPALVDKKDSVAIETFDNQNMARLMHKQGLIRLFRLQIESNLKFSFKAMKKWSEIQILASHWLPIKIFEDHFKQFLIAELFLIDDNSWPKNKVAFEQRLQQKKGEIMSFCEKMEVYFLTLFKQLFSINKRLKKHTTIDRAYAMADVKAHMQSLIPVEFLQQAGLSWLMQYPRYLQAIEIRLDKLPTQINQDRAYSEELYELHEQWSQKHQVLQNNHQSDDRLIFYRWMLEEYRVSLFAQQLGTRFPVSNKRLRKLWQEISVG